MQRNTISLLLVVIIILLAGYFSIQGLGDNYFWDDEATTAIFARNFNKFGKLTGWDGRNLLTYRDGLLLDQSFVNRFNSPLEFLVTAVSFKLFGETTFSARFFFVLFGVASLYLLCRICFLEFGGRSDITVFALFILAVSPSFLLFIRQCHYYSLTLFFSLLSYYGYKKYILTRKILYLAGAIIAFFGLFLSHYLIAVAFGIALAGIHLILFIKYRPRYPVIIAGLIVIIFIASYIHFYKVIIPTSHAEINRTFFLNKTNLLLSYFRDINAYTWYPWIMFASLIWVLFSPQRTPGIKKIIRELLLFIGLFIIVVVLLYPVMAREYSLVDIRYIFPLLPFFSLLLGVTLSYFKKISRLFALAVLLILIFSNLFSLNFWFPRKLRFDLINYLYEIHHDYLTAYEAAADFIHDECAQDDQIVVIPPNMSIPLQFYTGDRVIYAGRLDYSSKFPASKIKQLNPSLIVEEALPDWIISFRLRPLTYTIVDYFAGRGMEFSLFEILDVYYLGELARPEIFLHGYRPVKNFNHERDGILIYNHKKMVKP